MKYLILILALTLPFSIFASNSGDIKNLQEENQKIELELISIQDKMTTLSWQIKYLEITLNQEFVNKKILSAKLLNLKNDLIKKIDEKSEVINFKDVQEEEVKKVILNLWREEKKYETWWKFNFFKTFFWYFWFETSQKEKRNISKIEKMNERIFQWYLNLEWGKEEEIDDIQILKSKITKVNFEMSENWRNLVEIKKAKTLLFENYKWREEFFNEKVEENKKAMLLSLLDVKKTLLNQKEIEKKIEKAEKNKTFYKVEDFSKSENVQQSKDPYDASRFQSLEDNEFIWPVDPQRWITANFLDEWYKQTFWIKHYAIDIRAKQWTPVFASANSFVYKVVDWWMNYSYVILAHKWSIQTVYGHLSKINVKEWQIILKWAVIWFSGWMPWTAWAWNLTSWPHLHFEFHKDWKPVNPVDFLPEI